MSKTSLFPTRQGLQTLLTSLLKRATQEPVQGSMPLYIAGQRCGWLFPDAAQALMGTNGLCLSATAAHIGENVPLGEPLDALLAEIALKLKAAGCAPGWRNELLDVWTTPNEPSLSSPIRIAAIERGVMRPLGLTTRAVHLSGWSKDGRLWVARRALTKATDPGMWDTLVGGLVGNLEDAELALVREADEEAGLDAPDIATRTPLRTIAHMKRRIPEGFQTEAVLTCECILPDRIQPTNRDGEVMDIQLLDTMTLYKMLLEDAFTLEASIVIAEDLWQRAAD
ncbi:NUDIX hydrolase [Zwartia vadi]|uniref:NUDIX hydrolase n=1 Tax=Zwartia vadi TaxID=3058168 RepID=UPI0025B5D00A|nr:NUDIX domain-containing protein [Zwartia vadi]MDN3987766.1 NUDIX domain-containing protein [Zwartia vadi]